MKIAVLDNVPEGGAKRVVFEEIKRLALKHSIAYYTNTHKSAFDFEKFVKVNRFPLNIKRKRGWKRPQMELELLQEIPDQYRQMAKAINKSDADVVLAHPCQLTQAPYLLRYLTKPSVYFMEEVLRVAYEPHLQPLKSIKVPFRYYESARRVLIKNIDLINLRKATKLVTSSRFVARQIKQIYGRLAQAIHLGVDTNTFKPKQTYKLSPRTPRDAGNQLLFVGRKNHIDCYPLIKSVAKSLEPEFRVEYVTLSSNKFKLTDKKMAELYQTSLATLCLAFNEPFGLVAVESMACGTPVIAVNQGGYRETVIDNKTGFLIARSQESLIKSVYKLKSAPLRNKLSRTAVGHVKRNFSWDKHVAKLEKILADAQKS